MQVDYLRKGFHDPRWPLDICRTITIGDTGLVFGKGTCLARLAGGSGQLDFDGDEQRLLALLSVTYKKPISRDMIRPLEAAAHHWARGEKALANLRLVFANLPPLADPHDAHRLSLAEYLLDHGMAPRELMKELGLDPAVLGLDKYNPAQSRVPAGNGRESGRWGPGGGGAESGGDTPVQLEENKHKPGSEDRPIPRRSRDAIITVAGNGPIVPGGIEIVPHIDNDPLDPQGLNVLPPSPEEVIAIADTANSIVSGNPESLIALNPHRYKNFPSSVTGAVLPSIGGGYTTFYIRSAGEEPGIKRLIIGDDGRAYYTNNHYLSFYPVDFRGIKVGRK